MNPVFVICVVFIAFVTWIGIAFLFPTIGKSIKTWIECFKFITKDEEDEDE